MNFGIDIQKMRMHTEGYHFKEIAAKLVQYCQLSSDCSSLFEFMMFQNTTQASTNNLFDLCKKLGIDTNSKF